MYSYKGMYYHTQDEVINYATTYYKSKRLYMGYKDCDEVQKDGMPVGCVMCNMDWDKGMQVTYNEGPCPDE